jgi:hypothetical protein
MRIYNLIANDMLPARTRALAAPGRLRQGGCTLSGFAFSNPAPSRDINRQFAPALSFVLFVLVTPLVHHWPGNGDAQPRSDTTGTQQCCVGHTRLALCNS